MFGDLTRTGIGHDSEREDARVLIGFIVLGVALRLVRGLQDFPMWCDETMLAANLLDRRWTELADPLAYRQVCPLGFLALEWAVVQVLGFSAAALRLIPLLCAVASAPLFAALARRTLGAGTLGAWLAVAVFAVSEPPIRFAAEVKPYSADLLVSLVLLNLAVRWLQDPERRRSLWGLAAVVPFAVSVSLPSVFLIGAIAAVGLREVVVRRRAGLTLAYAGFLGATGLAVAAMAALGQYRATPESRAYFLKYWAGAFPPSWHDPAALAGWLVRTHTGPLFAYPHGVAHGLTWLTALVFAAFLVGIVVRARREAGLVLLLVLPFALVFAASAIRRYPYGLSVRVMQFLVPSTLLLAAAGASTLLARARPWPPMHRAAPALAVLLVVLGLGRLAHDLGHPYRTTWDRTAREFARWFWEELASDAELVCVRTDLGIPFRPGRWAYDGADQYLCFQRIYSRRHRQGRAPRWDAITPAHPLRCVLVNRLPADVPGFLDWIAAHQDRYTLSAIRSYPATRGSPVEPSLTYVVCEFVPANPTPVASVGRPSRTK